MRPPWHAVWIPLKVLQSVALWLVWKAAPTQEDLYLPLALFGTHLFLGNWWNVSCCTAAAGLSVLSLQRLLPAFFGSGPCGSLLDGGYAMHCCRWCSWDGTSCRRASAGWAPCESTY